MKNIVLDLDGTLLRNDKTLSAFTIEIINKLKSRNFNIVFATARPPRGVYNTFDYDFKKDHIIFYNGSLVHKNHETIYSNNLSQETLNKLVSLCESYKNKIVFGFERNDSLYTNGSFEHHFPKRFYIEAAAIKNLIFDSPKFLIDIPNNNTLEYIKTNLPNDCSLIVTDNCTLGQIMEKTVSKLNALKIILSVGNESLEDTICFGDDFNDIELFQYCGACVSLENSIDEIKTLSTHTTSSNNVDGVAHFLSNYYGL